MKAAAAALGLVALLGAVAWQQLAADDSTGPGCPAVATSVPADALAGAERVTVQRWVDGDTVDVAVEGGTARIRLRDIDTPEFRSYGGAREIVDRGRAQAATDRAHELADPGSTAWLFADDGADRYGRRVARIAADDGLDIGAVLLHEGHAVAWPDGGCDYPEPEQTP